MRAKVIAVNYHKGFVAVETDGGITVFELLGGYNIQIGDIISGNLESEGSEIFMNETQKEKMDVFVQGIYCTPQNASQLMA